MDPLRRLEAGAEAMMSRFFSQLKLDRIGVCAHSITRIATKTATAFERDMRIASTVVQKELKNKLVLSQWCNHFIADAKYEQLDPLSFAFARVSLNVAAGYTEVTYETLIQSNVHSFLVSLIAFPQDIVVGPAMLALCHISLMNEHVKHDIVHAGALPKLLRVATTNKSRPILSQLAKLSASLALHLPNKPLIASSGLLHALIDLTVGAHVLVDCSVQRDALTAIVNLVYASDANRSIFVGLSGIQPLIQCMLNSADSSVVLRSVQTCGNVAFRSGHTVGALVGAGADQAVLRVLAVADAAGGEGVAHACLLALTNMCVSARYRSHLAPSAAPLALLACASKDAAVVGQAALLLAALALDHDGNKALLCAEGALPVLLDCALAWGSAGHEHCAQGLCLALASLLLFAPNHELFYDVDGLNRVVALGYSSQDAALLRSLSMVLSALIPCPTELYRFHLDEFTSPVERANVCEVLKRIRFIGFHSEACPAWFDKSIAVLLMSDADLAAEKAWVRGEFCESAVCFSEVSIEIAPDIDIVSLAHQKGLMFTIY